MNSRARKQQHPMFSGESSYSREMQTVEMALLADVCERRIELVDLRHVPDDAFHYVDIASVDNSQKRITSPRTIIGRDAPSRARQRIRAGDVLVATTRPNLNAVALVPPELDGQIASTGFCLLRPAEKLDGDYLFAFVQSEVLVKRLSDLVKGALYPAVSDSQVFAQEIPLPPLTTQRRIAAQLKEQMAEVDRARAAVTAQLDAAKALPAALLRTVFDKTGDWRLGKLQEILLETRNGLYKPDHFYGRGTRILKMFNIGRFDGSWDIERVDQVQLTVAEEEQYRLDLGDILINRVNSRELVGKCAVIDDTTAGSVFESKNIRLRVKTTMADPYWTAIWLNSAGCRCQTTRSMKQIIGQATLNRADLDAIEIPLPPLPVQCILAARLSSEIAAATELREALERKLADIDRLPAALLRQVFGEVIVADDGKMRS